MKIHNGAQVVIGPRVADVGMPSIKTASVPPLMLAVLCLRLLLLFGRGFLGCGARAHAKLAFED